MSDFYNGIVSGIVGAVAGGVTGFLASRFSNYLDNKGKITIKTSDVKLEYRNWSLAGIKKFPEGYNSEVNQILLSFKLEIRNTSKIRKDYKNGKLIIRSNDFVEEAELYSDMKNQFQHAMLEPLESKITKVSSTLKIDKFKNFLGKKVEFYMAITDSKEKITEVLVGTYDKL